jgi:hypothetical protein
MAEIQNSKHVQSHQTIISNWSKNFMPAGSLQISDHQQNWGYEDGPWKGLEPPLLVAADLIHKPPASIRFAPITHALAVTVEPFKFSPAEPVAYELS